MATTTKVSRSRDRKSASRFSKAYSATRPTTRPQITTGFTPSSPAIILNAPFKARRCWPALRPPPATWCTCPAISSIAWATTLRPSTGSPRRWMPTSATCASNTSRPDDDWNYVHNMMYAIANLMEQGKLAEANALSDHLAAARGKLSATLYIWSARDQMARISRRLPVALRVGDWDAVLSLPRPGQSLADTDKTANLRCSRLLTRRLCPRHEALSRTTTSATAEIASDHMDAGLWRAQRESDAKDEAKKARRRQRQGQAGQHPAHAADFARCDGRPACSRALSVASMELHAGVLAGQGKLPKPGKKFAARTLQKRSSAITSRRSTFGPSAKTRPSASSVPRIMPVPRLPTKMRSRSGLTPASRSTVWPMCANFPAMRPAPAKVTRHFSKPGPPRIPRCPKSSTRAQIVARYYGPSQPRLNPFACAIQCGFVRLERNESLASSVSSQITCISQ